MTKCARQWGAIVLGLAVVCSTAGAAPQSAPAGEREQRLLRRFDRDGDGKLSLQERRQARRQLQASRPAAQAEQAKATGLPSGVKAVRDVEYARAGGTPLRLDLYLSVRGNRDKRPVPLIVWIHGGGWQTGSKAACPMVSAVDEGYVVASVDYRLTDEAIFPAQIYDCKAAIRWLRAHAAEYGYDPDQIGVAGASAGGHLVALLGTSGGVKDVEGDVGDNLRVSSEVQAVADFCGPTTLTAKDLLPEGAERRDLKVLNKLFGGPVREHEALARLASPSVYVSKDDPPFLIIHGEKDPLVPVNQAQILDEKLTKAGVEHTLHIVKGGGHGVVNPETLRMAMAFFDKHLKATVAARAAHAVSQPAR